ncbi:hypothetical protein, conserved [Trypanosoma brucei brucei TREU927]|uniref:COG4 transport protein middle alpha-helical bundle domain-containing protein n=3 Tax=Trypanosoma brucei brucei (strain 927/4 GUTat10.1) TaxID=185431 RepID=D6XJQ7_TRYB2|nr:hypothetical protein, conserved [Trypanosoma brucei brucei TREU927]AAZ12790.1 hypothetical protein, conserved [Trypanosoma brucei brucei TREU927]
MEQYQSQSHPQQQSQQVWNSLDDRVEFLLRRVAKLTEQRQHIAQDIARSVIADGGSLSSSIEEIKAVSYGLLPQFADRGAGLARHIAISASLAESSSRRVKQLDFLLSRVRAARMVADSLQEMRRSVIAVQTMIDRDELESAVQLIRKYEEASGKLGGRSVSARILLREEEGEDEHGEEVVSGVEEEEEEEEEVQPAVKLSSDEQMEERKETVSAVTVGETLQTQGIGDEGGVLASTSSTAGGHETAAEPRVKAAAKMRRKGTWKKGSSGCDEYGGRAAHNDNDVTANRGEVDDEVDRIIVNARQTVREKLMKRFYSAKVVNDKQTIMDTVRLLTLLGFRDECCCMYCSWMCEHTIVALNKMVERELRKIDDPNEAGMSHLALVSAGLDLVVATFENEEEFVLETFGDAGLLLLLTELHSRSTSQCVPVLKDFLKKRQEVLQAVDCTNNSPSPRGESNDNSGRSAVTSPRQPRALQSRGTTLDPRRTDQILEEMSHLVSCYHLYWTFAQSKQQECTQRVREKEGGAREQNDGMNQSADSLWSSRDNPLMTAVQEILAIFVPLQTHYFEAAFHQVLQIQLDAINASSHEHPMPSTTAAVTAGNNSTKQQVGYGSTTSNKAAATLMTGLAAAIYNSTTSGSSANTGGNDASGMVGALVNSSVSGAGNNSGIAVIDEDFLSSTSSQQLAPITLPDDVFYFLRISLHRAVNTKSTQIISAVFIACGELVQSQLIPTLNRYTALPHTTQLQKLQTVHQQRAQQQQGHNYLYTVPTRILRWTAATQCTITYIRRFADELRQLSRSQFSGKDVLRFSEQADDMDGTARELSTGIQQKLEDYAERCYQAHLARHIEPFATLSYEMTEDVFYQYELSDPWVQAFIAAADAALAHFDTYLDPRSFDLLLLALVKRVVSVARSLLLRKSISAYGALQVDREVRTFRTFFTGRAHEEQLREPFIQLMDMTALLLLDHPREAEQKQDQKAFQGGGFIYGGNELTPDEKRRVLRCRVEFKQEDIDRLRL